ncbi:MAG: 3-hydroxyacyl-ACP dehydratase FabZ family protein [Bacteroidales bacterium]
MRFILVDKIVELVAGDSAKGVKCITLTNEIFNEHFPNYPIFPGSLILEGMAQLAGVLLSHTLIEEGHPYRVVALTMVKNLKFRAIIHPGDRLIYSSKIKYFYPNEYAAVVVKGEREGELCAGGELIFSFLESPNPQFEKEMLHNLKLIIESYKGANQ